MPCDNSEKDTKVLSHSAKSRTCRHLLGILQKLSSKLSKAAKMVAMKSMANATSEVRNLVVSNECGVSGDTPAHGKSADIRHSTGVCH